MFLMVRPDVKTVLSTESTGLDEGIKVVPNRSPFSLSETHERSQELVFRLKIAGGVSRGISHHVRIRGTSLTFFPRRKGWDGVVTSLAPQLLQYFLCLIISRGILAGLIPLVFKSATLDPVVVTEGHGWEQ